MNLLVLLAFIQLAAALPLIENLRVLFGNDPFSYDPEILAIWNDLELLEKTQLDHAIYSFMKEKPIKNKKSPTMTHVWDSTVTITSFEDYSLRVKKTNPKILGIDKVDQYAGYLDIISEDKHFFYWFFESRNDPENEPLILCVIFLEQPIGVGYSYSNTSKPVGTTDAAASDVYAFLELFFKAFPKFRNNKFHIAGESYGGHYIPRFASEIINHPDRSFELTSIMVGNGITDPLSQFGYYEPMACGRGGHPPVISERECEDMRDAYPRCAKLIEACYKTDSAFVCIPAGIYCERKMFSAFEKTGLNVYDIRKKCDPDTELCYKDLDYVDAYMNLDYVKQSLGAEVDNYVGCSSKVGTQFALTGDGMKPFHQYISELLEKGYPVLLYAGDKDYICNWLGNYGWSDELEYIYHDKFTSSPMLPYVTLEDKFTGYVRNYGDFTFLRVFDAGHMVPYDQPVNALDMVNRWINGDYSFGY
ncbi:S10 family peptidase ASCRUDRAFT_6748 [Ascoidea rubescens DSM 1968]|uniref:Carboxypeptidase n=1 Tax=Ascoidea rubescens DSM 1968 TaxID=1344418 RepID=A0A1D2VNL7_9ASCO|nr:hypothetical protein ASCRUDRAFT_6748 [Ascoidea rubescens DSM 1968]ODV63184.1 hypothetical protein ASCRUDRAFT_6748 [Ascoidea rubescens DSM 1968]